MSQAILARLRESRRATYEKLQAVVRPAADVNRALTDDEQRAYDNLTAELDAYDARIGKVAEQEKRSTEAENTFKRLSDGRPLGERNPLAFSSQALDALQAAIDSRTAGRFVGADVEQRAALATTTYGAPRAWGANVLSGPRLLHVAAGVPQQPIDAVYAQFPSLTLPAASASVGENVTLAEYASSTAGSVTLGRYGRWTDLSRESLVGADAGAIVGMHQIGVAKDLDSALITAVNTAAGAAVAFTADVPAAVRKAQAQVIDNTAAADAADLVICVHPDNAALLQDVTPVGGATIAEGFQKFSGALVYPSSAVPTGFALVANLRAGARYFEARGLVTETDEAIKTATLTVATSVIGGYGLGLVGGASGFVIKVDVVTP